MKLAGDRLFAIITLLLVSGGLAVFFSASLGVLASGTVSLSRIAITQLVLGLVLGLGALVALRFTPYRQLSRYAFPVYVGTLLFTLLVFVPGIGASANGASRWIDVRFTTIQPAEFLKFGVILFFAAYLAKNQRRLSEWKVGLLGFAGIVGVPAVILLAQPNTSTTFIVGVTCFLMYFLSGAPLRDFAIIIAIGVIGVGSLIAVRPYALARITTFLHPASDPTGAGYQIQQALIAIGSGRVIGRGFGQGVQKFNYLPDPIGDSVFATMGEEFGFIGSVLFVLLFVAFMLRGLAIAGQSADLFGALLVIGLTLTISLSAFVNMGAMLGILPLTGLPLPFVSHGGTALMMALASVGLILNVAARRSKAR
ncbi:MAG: cell division protein FtsW [Patescibacteria group bacterium]|nr:putative lipid II flippase FtsW [Patescibacteria group bacterium]MDE1965937.1 cell division protein FtsW [Patescibacteria group bacterium]